MPQLDRRWDLGLGLSLAMAALAPAQQQVAPPAATPAVLAKVRAEAAAKTYDEAWLYYSENRIDADKVYRWSRRLWEADHAAAATREGWTGAAEGHLVRMRKLEAKIARIRQLGFGNSLDVLEVEYYRKEAEFWRADAEAR